ncbi:AEC family transporter [uncultured Ruegeria sp.]|uniref:AEC family transporter n=1 Tax=uncultured Ruegeria sp. TaxID=259304 RepID=UPI00260F2722|nr:AEC family transporter [uncultured Ruegeria sp.]
MIDILSITGTIFVVIGAGYLSVRLGVFSSGEMQILGRFVVNFALPALIFRAVSTQPITEFANAGYLGAVFMGSLVVFWSGYFWSRRVAGERASASTFNAMGMSCANSGFVGFPILLISLPDVASTALALNMIIENLVMIPLVLIMAEYSRKGDMVGNQITRQIAWRLVRNPIVIALVLGLTISASGLTMPTVIERPIDMFASASAAVSLAVIGGTLASLPLREIKAPVFRITAGKLLIHPAAIALSFFAVSLIGVGVQNEQLIAAAVILASTPVMGIYPILAQSYGEERTASLAMLVMTAASFFTMSLVLAIVLV